MTGLPIVTFAILSDGTLPNTDAKANSGRLVVANQPV